MWGQRRKSGFFFTAGLRGKQPLDMGVWGGTPEERGFEGNWGRVLAARRPRRPCGQDGPARGAWNARAELRTLLGPVGLGEGVRTGMTDRQVRRFYSSNSCSELKEEGGLLNCYFLVRNKTDLGCLDDSTLCQGTKIVDAFAGVGLVDAGCGTWRRSL